MKTGTFKERMTAYVKELVNPMSYYDWVNQNTTIQGMPFTCDRYPFQKQLLNDMSQELHCVKPSQIGLALCLKTPIFSEKGWTTMGEVQVGDYIYAPDGSKTKVVFKSEIYTDHRCFEITLNDGTTVIADENHKWLVDSQYKFKSEKLKKEGGRYVGVANTLELFEKQHKAGRNSFSISNTKPINTEHTDFELDPYILGLWLGNGNSHTGYITILSTDVEEITSNIDSNKYDVIIKEAVDKNTKTLVVKQKNTSKTLMAMLKDLGVLKGDKVFPKQYLFCSKEQRLNLIQGLMDTDGNIEKKGSCCFSNTNKSIIDGLQQTLAFLGITSNHSVLPIKNKTSLGFEQKQDLHIVRFKAYSDLRVSGLKRKYSRQIVKTENQKGVYYNKRKIISVVEVKPVPVQCIQVDHPDHLFLCTKNMIATHNTEIQLRKALAYVTRNPHRNLIYTMPDENMRKRLFQNRMLPILTQDTVFHSLNSAGKKPIRSIEITEINNSQMLMFPANEKSATSQPADVVFNDEVDLSDPQIIALFNSRLQGSDVKINHNYSTPTYAGIGIDALYQTSDQHEYMFQCPHCNFYQLPEFTTKFIRIPNLPMEANDDLSKFEPQWIDKYKINPLDAYSVCYKCGKKVTYGDDENHQWVSKHPHRTTSRGYKISPFSTRNLDAAYVLTTLLKYIRGDNMKGFYNTVLGLTHENSDERLPEGLLRNLFTPNFDPIYDGYGTVPHFIGIDMGKVCHVSIGMADSLTKIKTVLLETVKAEELPARITSYMKQFPIKGGFIDRLPLITDSDKVRVMTDNVIMPIQYEQNSGGAMLVPKNDEYGALSYVGAHRTMHLDTLVSAIKNGWIEFSGYGSQKETIISHLRAMVRMLAESKEGTEKVPVWIKKDKNDHYFHSLGYLNQAVHQYYNGYSFLPDQSYNSTIYLGGMDNFITPSQSLFGRN